MKSTDRTKYKVESPTGQSPVNLGGIRDRDLVLLLYARVHILLQKVTPLEGRDAKKKYFKIIVFSNRKYPESLASCPGSEQLARTLGKLPSFSNISIEKIRSFSNSVEGWMIFRLCSPPGKSVT